MAKFSLQAFLYLCIAAVANAFVQNGAARSMMKAGKDQVHIFICIHECLQCLFLGLDTRFSIHIVKIFANRCNFHFCLNIYQVFTCNFNDIILFYWRIYFLRSALHETWDAIEGFGFPHSRCHRHARLRCYWCVDHLHAPLLRSYIRCLLGRVVRNLPSRDLPYCSLQPEVWIIVHD